jgi:hypothetical protein
MGYIFVFEYMLSDLSEVIRNVNKPLTNSQIKSYMRMLLNGVSFCHENRIMHRVKSHKEELHIKFIFDFIGFKTSEFTYQYNRSFKNSGFRFSKNIR